MARQRLGGPVVERLAAGHVEPDVGHARRKGQPPAELAERHEQEAATGGAAAQLQRQADALLGEPRVEGPAGQLVVTGVAAESRQVLVEVLGQAAEDAVELVATQQRPREKQRPDLEHGCAAGRLAAFDVNGDGQVHGAAPGDESVSLKQTARGRQPALILSEAEARCGIRLTSHCPGKASSKCSTAQRAALRTPSSGSRRSRRIFGSARV